MKKVTIINAYGDKNIGDAAILNVAIQFLNEAYEYQCAISVLCENTESYSSFIGSTQNVFPFQLPYGYAIRSASGKASEHTKLIRFFIIHVISLWYILLDKLFGFQVPSKGFYSYISAIKNAESVIGMGGGYFITNDKHKDYFGLLLTLLPVYIAKIYKKQILFLPMSFGPFASTPQERITYRALKGTTVIARDHVTLEQLGTVDTKNSIKKFYAPDLALFFNPKQESRRKKAQSKYLVLTAREWFLEKDKQAYYEASLVRFIEKAWKKYGLRTIFIPMARNVIEDDDNRVAKRIVNAIKTKSLVKIYTPKSLFDLQDVLKHARIAVCTRMHSAILSATVNTPFIAIGYGHKTKGFVESFGISEWHIDINHMSFYALLERFEKLLQKRHYDMFRQKIEKKEKAIQKYKAEIINEIKLTGNI